MKKIHFSTVIFLSKKRHNGRMTATVSKDQIQSVIVSQVSSICKKIFDQIQYPELVGW